MLHDGNVWREEKLEMGKEEEILQSQQIVIAIFSVPWGAGDGHEAKLLDSIQTNVEQGASPSLLELVESLPVPGGRRQEWRAGRRYDRPFPACAHPLVLAKVSGMPHGRMLASLLQLRGGDVTVWQVS
eukprot:765353-Hanusia_phi.AAC.2